jgi:putative (di)nucleoside polyphosphate hydrolase
VTDPAYRPGVGVVLVNRAGLVFVGRRAGLDAADPWAWQMPQGGIDAGEEPLAAARRELYEETNVSSVSLLAEAPEWFRYDLPADVARKSWKGRYRGQAQKWFAFRFEGEDGEIDIERPGGGGHKPEFSAWRWVRMAELPGLAIPFRRPVYERVVEVFGGLAGQGQ